MAAPDFQIEAHLLTATLYLRGPLSTDNLPELLGACALLPATVRTLRIDASALRPSDAKTREVLDRVARYWKRARGGCTPPLQGATQGELPALRAQRSAATRAMIVPINPAITDRASTGRFRVSAATAPSAMATCSSATASA